MEFYNKVKSQQDQPDQGELKVSVFTEDGTRPVENALVRSLIPERVDRRWKKYVRIHPGRHRLLS